MITTPLMRTIPLFRLGLGIAGMAALTGIAAACDDPLGLLPAQSENMIDTVVLSALTGTPVTEPSGFYLVYKVVARTDRGNETFDFAVDIDESGAVEVFPTGALGLSALSAVIKPEDTFENITEAPVEGFISDSAISLNLNEVFVVRSQAVREYCPLYIGALPRYGKFRVMEVDSTTRKITLEFLVNANCGYRSLEVGIPTQ
ncbi:MAG: hypothetical protein OEY63_07660 [Gemmatimonadota bacterium]|nr:hypothetical protein [Gemmatimonadota bacterium]MDH5805555.1 hypothetical protein [Gemmatimonadota bacterium]